MNGRTVSKHNKQRAGEPRAGGASPRPKTDRFLRWLGRLALGVFFREIKVVGVENFPKTGAAIVVSNHFNSIADGAIITTFLPRMPRFLVASIVWDFKLVAPLLSAAGAVPVFRRQDNRQHQGRLADTFAAAADLLGSGGVLAIFPEGKSHSEASLLPLKSGAARIALLAEHDHGPLDLKVVPVGLYFEAKNEFRSRVLIEIGIPFDADSARVAQQQSTVTAQAAAAKMLTADIADGLASVALNYQGWEDARLIEQAADIWVQPKPDLPYRPDLVKSAMSRRRFQEGYVSLSLTHPEMIQSVRNEIAEYVEMLRVVGLRDEQVAASYPRDAALRFLGRSLFALIINLPLSIIGVLLNGLPYAILLLASRRKDFDKRSSWSLFAGVFLFPMFWLITAGIAGVAVGRIESSLVGWLSAVAISGLAPVTGKTTIAFRDLSKSLAYEIRAWSLLRTSIEIRSRLTQKRAILVEKLGVLSNAIQPDAT